MLEVLYHRPKFGGTRMSPAAGAAKNVEVFVCLSVCSFITLLNFGVYARRRSCCELYYLFLLKP